MKAVMTNPILFPWRVFGPEVKHQHLAKNTLLNVKNLQVFDKDSHDVKTEDRKPNSQKNIHGREGVAPEGDQSGPAKLENVGEDEDRRLQRSIPDICHEPHEYIRVNFFWLV